MAPSWPESLFKQPHIPTATFWHRHKKSLFHFAHSLAYLHPDFETNLGVRQRMESRPFSDPSPLLPCNRCPIWLPASKTGPKLDPLAIVSTDGGKKVGCCFRSAGNLLSGDQCLTERSLPVLKLVSVSCWRRTLSSCPCPTLSLWEQNSLKALVHFSIEHALSN